MLAKEVIAEYGGRVGMVVGNFGESELARRFGVTQYPAIWVDEVLVARPNDFYLWENEKGKYTPWRDAGNHLAFQRDLRGMLDRALAGGTLEGYTPEDAAAGEAGPLSLPDFSLLDLEGHSVGPGQLSGKPAVVEFWATWCPPCRSTLEWLDGLKERHGSGLGVLAIAVESEEEPVRELTAEIGADFLVAMGSEETARAFGNVVGIPTLFVFDAEGRVAGVFYGAPEDLHERVERLLGSLGLAAGDSGRERSR